MTRKYLVILKDETLEAIQAKDLHDAWTKAIKKWGRLLHSVDVGWDN